MNSTTRPTTLIEGRLRSALGKGNPIGPREDALLITPFAQIAQALGYTVADVVEPRLNTCGIERDPLHHCIVIPPGLHPAYPSWKSIGLHISGAYFYPGVWTVHVSDSGRLEFTHMRTPIDVRDQAAPDLVISLINCALMAVERRLCWKQ